jgi:hypothetical protein
MNNYYEYKYGERYGYRYMDEDLEPINGGYSSGSSYSVNVESQTKKLQKRQEKEANIPKRALMLEKFFDDNLPHLPHLPSGLWNIIAEYEGRVESSVLGDNITNTSSWSCYHIL